MLSAKIIALFIIMLANDVILLPKPMNVLEDKLVHVT